MNPKITEIANKNLDVLRANPYPGRGLVLGRMEDGNLVLVYWLMGRSAGSRNRLLVAEDGKLSTSVADKKQGAGDPMLTIYNAMNEYGLTHFVVSNGNQTDRVVEALSRGRRLEDGLVDSTYEPDAPNFTPRITGAISLGQDHRLRAEISILRKSPLAEVCERHLYHWEAMFCGVGYCVHTYMGDGNPLPSFFGEPYIIPLHEDVKTLGEHLWRCLNEDNRISLGIKVINPNSGLSEIHIWNRFPSQ